MRASWAALLPRGSKENDGTLAGRSGSPPREGTMWTHPVETAVAPRGGAKGGELSSTRGAVPDFLVLVAIGSRPRSEAEGRSVGGVAT